MDGSWLPGAEGKVGKPNGAKPPLKTDLPAPVDTRDVACFSGLLGVGQASAIKG